MSDIREKADKLHDLGHEVAAAALRRSEMWDKSDIRHFEPIQVFNRHLKKHLPTAFQPGRVVLKTERDHPEHGLTMVNTYNAMRVGKHIGPVTRDEMVHTIGHQPYGRTRTYAIDHPLASGGHGLHSSDPNAESFRLFHMNLHRPDVWPILADHFEEHGGLRAEAMAKILRGHQGEAYDSANVRTLGSITPVTWPIRVHQYPSHHDDDYHHFHIGNVSLRVPKSDKVPENLE